MEGNIEKFTKTELNIALRVAMTISDHADECSMHPDMRIASEFANLLYDYYHEEPDTEHKKFVNEMLR